MGLGDAYPVVAADELPADGWTELAGEVDDRAAFQRTVVQAHQELARLEGPAGEPFREVVRCLAKDLEAGKAP
jgi:hypothetical protein